MKNVSIQWTVVQHSGHHKPGFRHGLQEAAVNSDVEIKRVHKAGGKLFASYDEAADYCMKEQYPADVQGLYPRAPGKFVTAQINGLKIYVPKGETL